MERVSIIARKPRLNVSVLAASFAAIGAILISHFVIPCTNRTQETGEILFCMSKYIAKFAILSYPILSYPIGAVASFVIIGCTVLLFSNAKSCLNVLYVGLISAIGGSLVFPLASGAIVLALQALDPYWRDVNSQWMFKGILRGSFWFAGPYALIWAAISGMLASFIVRRFYPASSKNEGA